MSFRRFKPRLSAGTVGWLLLAAFLGYRMWPQVAAAFGVGAGGSQAPDVRVTTLEGDTISLAQLRGKVVLVNFWATWCAPCRIEMPGFQRIYDARRDAGFTMVGISTDARGSDHVRQYLREHAISYPIAMATGDAVQRFGGVNVLPSSFLIDREGRIRHEVRGYFSEVALREAVDRLLVEPVPAGRSE